MELQWDLSVCQPYFTASWDKWTRLAGLPSGELAAIELTAQSK
jgi:hypothetical protein